ncbi:GAK10 protein, partial [Phainopepla nitens]|nr:GAK10 protein [Phainopepla nitens]
MVAAFAALKGSSGIPGVCFNCSKPGHLKKDCFAWKGAKPKAPDVCPRCCKGHHFANLCCSDSEGRPIQGNWNWSVGRHRAQTPIPQPTLQMPPAQMSNGDSLQVFT